MEMRKRNMKSTWARDDLMISIIQQPVTDVEFQFLGLFFLGGWDYANRRIAPPHVLIFLFFPTNFLKGLFSSTNSHILCFFFLPSAKKKKKKKNLRYFFHKKTSPVKTIPTPLNFTLQTETCSFHIYYMYLFIHHKFFEF